MAKKKKSKIPNLPKHLVNHSNAFRCLICGEVVEGLYLNRHLLVAHKIDTTNVKSKFTDLGTPFKRNKNAKWIAIMREYERNHSRPKPEYDCGSNPIKPRPIKLIYTPMGNKR
ncbi:MAG: hypothetical protein K2H47_06895 [Muribaculaceae bacterium]|nr:hypothetical protein [Muribaculaceae bacterium]